MGSILIFWLCPLSVVCQPYDVRQRELPTVTVAQCDIINAISDDKFMDELLSYRLVPRHICKPMGEDT